MAQAKATATEAVDADTGDILEVEILAPDVVSQALTKYNVTDAALAELTAAWKGFTIQGVEDKDGYTKAVEGYRTLKKLRTGTEAKRKALKEPFLNAGKLIDAEAKRITAVIEPLETGVKEQVDLIDKQLEALRREEERRRIKLLTDAGFQLSGQFYVLGPNMILFSDVMAFSEEKLQEEVARGSEWAKAEAERKAAEQAELEELRRLKAENDAKAAALAKQQAELDAQQKAIDDQRASLAREAGGYSPASDTTSPEPPYESGTAEAPVFSAPEGLQIGSVQLENEAPAIMIVGRGQVGTSAPAQQQAPQAAAPQAQAPAEQHISHTPNPAFKSGWNHGIERIIQVFLDPQAPQRKRAEWAEVFRSELIS